MYKYLNLSFKKSLFLNDKTVVMYLIILLEFC